MKLFLVALAIIVCSAASDRDVPKPNVVLVYVDDLRVNDDGTEHMPHQDALRGNGVSFTQARAMYPMCGPSRNALLSGMRPDSSQTWCDPTTETLCIIRAWNNFSLNKLLLCNCNYTNACTHGHKHTITLVLSPLRPPFPRTSTHHLHIQSIP